MLQKLRYMVQNRIFLLRLCLAVMVGFLVGFLVFNLYPSVSYLVHRYLSGWDLFSPYLGWLVPVLSLLLVAVGLAALYVTDELLFAKVESKDARLVVRVLFVFFTAVEILVTAFVVGEKSAAAIEPLELSDPTAGTVVRDVDARITALDARIVAARSALSAAQKSYNQLTQKSLWDNSSAHKSALERAAALVESSQKSLDRLEADRRVLDIERSGAVRDARLKNEELATAHEEKVNFSRWVGRWQGTGLSLLILFFVWAKMRLSGVQHFYKDSGIARVVHNVVRADSVVNYKTGGYRVDLDGSIGFQGFSLNLDAMSAAVKEKYGPYLSGLADIAKKRGSGIREYCDQVERDSGGAVKSSALRALYHRYVVKNSVAV